MRRRDFIKGIAGSAVTWPIVARAQQTSGIPRIGFVYQGSQAAMALRIEAILSGLRVSGFAAPAQVEIVGRAAEGDPARIAPLVAEVIAKNVSVIMPSGPRVLNAARSATRTIPIDAMDFEAAPFARGGAASRREQAKALARRRAVGSRYRTRASGFGSESRKNVECPVRGRRGTSSFRFRCCFLDGKPPWSGR